MKTLTLTNQAKKTVTVLENEFIDRYMPKANGEYVKVYLMLLRHLDESASLPAPSRLASVRAAVMAPATVRLQAVVIRVRRPAAAVRSEEVLRVARCLWHVVCRSAASTTSLQSP